MKKLTLYIGLPASGKSTLAQKAVEAGKGKIKRVERDMLREMLDFGVFSGKNEKTVTEVQDLIISYLLDKDHEVIVSDTNLNPRTRQRLVENAVAMGASVEQDRSFLDVSVDTCIARDLKRFKSVGEQVIRRMYQTYVKPITAIEKIEDVPNVVICDLDGTLADLNGRSPYNASTCEFDILRTHVRDAVVAMTKATSAKLMLFSGRHDTYRTETERWLAAHNVPYDELHMRKAGDNRADTIVKEEIFDDVVRNRYNVVGVFDDRPVVVRLWRSLGLPVFDVGNGVDF